MVIHNAESEDHPLLSFLVNLYILLPLIYLYFLR